MTRFAPRLVPLDDRIVPSALTTLVDTTSAGAQVAGSNSFFPAISADGRFVAFLSDAALSPDDTNGVRDVYLKDRTTGTTTLVSRADGATGAAGNAVVVNEPPSVSSDGRYVAFGSSASNLVVGDANGQFDAFVRDTVAGTTTLVSRGAAFGVSGDGFSGQVHISADGKFVSFASQATNLVAGVTTSGFNIFRRDLTANTTRLISADASGNQQNAGAASLINTISADGRFVAFSSTASNLVTGDANGQQDVFIADVVSGTIQLVSVASSGTQANGLSANSTLSVSADGRYVAFDSTANNLAGGDTNGQQDIFLRDTVANVTTLVSSDAAGSIGNGQSVNPAISGNGRYIAFTSQSSNLVIGDANSTADIFVKDRITGAVTLASVSTGNVAANAASSTPAISRDGQFIAFDSLASSLAADDNGGRDVFVRQRPLPVGYAAAVGTGVGPVVNVYNAAGQPTASFFAYDPTYGAGVFVSLGDVTGDGRQEVVTSTGPGGTANVRVFTTAGQSGSELPLVASFFAYPTAFVGGVNVALADVNGDGYADIICGVGVGGGPNVRILDGRQVSLGNFSLAAVADGGALIASFFAYPEGFTGGVRVAAADVDGDGLADVICGVGSGGGPNVRVFDARRLLAGDFNPTTSFFALPSTFTGGLFVSTGDVNNDGVPDLIVGVESGGGPNARAYDLKTQAVLQSFFAFDQTQTGGVRVAGTDVNQDGYDDFILGTGPAVAGTLRALNGRTLTPLLADTTPFGGSFTGGVNVG